MTKLLIENSQRLLQINDLIDKTKIQSSQISTKVPENVQQALPVEQKQTEVQDGYAKVQEAELQLLATIIYKAVTLTSSQPFEALKLYQRTLTIRPNQFVVQKAEEQLLNTLLEETQKLKSKNPRVALERYQQIIAIIPDRVDIRELIVDLESSVNELQRLGERQRLLRDIIILIPIIISGILLGWWMGQPDWIRVAIWGLLFVGGGLNGFRVYYDNRDKNNDAYSWRNFVGLLGSSFGMGIGYTIGIGLLMWLVGLATERLLNNFDIGFYLVGCFFALASFVVGMGKVIGQQFPFRKFWREIILIQGQKLANNPHSRKLFSLFQEKLPTTMSNRELLIIILIPIIISGILLGWWMGQPDWIRVAIWGLLFVGGGLNGFRVYYDNRDKKNDTYSWSNFVDVLGSSFGMAIATSLGAGLFMWLAGLATERLLNNFDIGFYLVGCFFAFGSFITAIGSVIDFVILSKKEIK